MAVKKKVELDEVKSSAGNGAEVADAKPEPDNKNRLADKAAPAEPMPTIDAKDNPLSKVEMVNWVLTQLGSATTGDAMALYNSLKSAWDAKQVETTKNTTAASSIKTHEAVDTIFGTDVSEEFKSKAATLFEAHLGVATAARIAEIEEAFDARVAEAVEKKEAALNEQLGDFLDYTANQWIERNELAVTSGLRADMAESFINAMKNVFETHYVEIPEAAEDVVGKLSESNAELEDRLNEELQTAIALNKKIEVLECEKVFTTATAGLTATQRDSVKKLSENVEFADLSEYSSKVKTLVESTNGPSKKIILEDNLAGGGPLDTLVEAHKGSVDPVVQAYADALTRSLRK